MLSLKERRCPIDLLYASLDTKVLNDYLYVSHQKLNMYLQTAILTIDINEKIQT